jgi:hypothetical protein
MGTRSTTTIYDGETPLVTIYRQFDGYPSGHGAELASFLTGKTIVNGFGRGDTAQQFNGAGDLACRLITALKDGDPNDIGGFYVIPTDQAGGEDYHYDVFVGEPGTEPHVKVSRFGNFVAEGPASEIVALAEAAEANDED